MSNEYPAFPYTVAGDHNLEAHQGMSLRDYFAAQVAPSVFADYAWAFRHPEESGDADDINMATVAEEAYALADAMLAERAKAKGEK